MNKLIHFLLAPDKYAARKIRRRIVESGGRLGVVVGTWLELLTLAGEKYLVPEASNNWATLLSSAMAGKADAFWIESFQVAPAETMASVNQSLISLIEGLEPGKHLAECDSTPLKRRAETHFLDLAWLQESLGGALPPALEVIQQVLAAGRPLKEIKVYRQSGFPELTRWQEAMLNRLARDAEQCQLDDALQEILETSLDGSPSAKGPSALNHIQQNLFSTDSAEIKRDHSLQWVACRDFQEEVEVTISMIQQLLRDDRSLKVSDIGIMLPADGSYARVVKNIVDLAGLPVSGLDVNLAARDLGREAIMLFITSRRKPAPLLALASLLSHPLMPWSAEHGMTLAQELMNGRFDFKPLAGMDDQGRQMLALIKKEVKLCGELKKDLAAFIDLLAGSEAQFYHLAMAREVASGIINELPAEGEPTWQRLISICSPQAQVFSEAVDNPRDGLCVFNESAEPWRALRHLFVLGFSSGRYPAEPSTSAVFSENDLLTLKGELQFKIECADDVLRRKRNLFKRQICAVEERINFFWPCRDVFGGELAPSSSLTFIAMLIAGVQDPEGLLLNLDLEADRNKIVGLPAVKKIKAIPLREIQIKDLNLGFDLMTINQKENGELRTQSPSRLGTLMTSPLAWVFNRAGIEPRKWAPESLDIMTKGTLAHEVFEHLFPVGSSFPSHQEIADQVPGLLNKAIINNSPFVLTPEWHVERHHLEREIITAAEVWTDMLVDMGATIIGAELGLEGEFEGLPLYGRADLIIELPGKRTFVIDFKKSKSKARREQMESGYDSQAELYRQMLKTGGFTNKDLKLSDKLEIGAMYYLMNDQVALTDSSGWFATPIMGLVELGDGISTQAVDLLKKRIGKVRKGEVRLNRDTDEKWFEKNAGVKIYALDNSPLMRKFILPAEEGENEIA
ncbi:MAG: exodeoxyribonuclease V subunit gamma [Proteobacteria bacterium]|nr:exodeoxyribonuclease V subunit gamma [Pseudomonadota bacterium]MBU1716659.1 exodeoxyribonuclease V subunit gamma [Pseudomonadota bacterium]